MTTTNFQFSFTVAKQPNDVFLHLINPKNWWVGFYEETITGSSQKVNDEFLFHAGGGMHITKHRLSELVPNKKIVWEVIKSNLSFLKDPNEWVGTKFGFDISQEDGKTKITFTHQGLEPEIECYDQCSSAWFQYLHQLKESLQRQ